MEYINGWVKPTLFLMTIRILGFIMAAGKLDLIMYWHSWA